MDTPFFNPDEIRILIQDNLNNGVIEKALSQLTMEDINNAIVEYGGLTDPIGQLENWLAQQLSNLANYITTGMRMTLLH